MRLAKNSWLICLALLLNFLLGSPVLADVQATSEFVSNESSCINTVPPVIPVAVNLSAVFGEIIIYKLPVYDFADDTLKFELSDSSPGGPVASNLNSQTGLLTYQPLLVGTITFTIKVTDCKNNVVSAPVTIEVKENPYRPKIVNLRYIDKKNLQKFPQHGPNKRGLFMDDEGSNIREYSTVVITKGSLVEKFPLEFFQLARTPENPSWGVLYTVRSIVDPAIPGSGNKRLKDLILRRQKVNITVITNNAPSETVDFTFGN